MRRRDKFKPYIRRARRADRSESIRVAMQLAYHGGRGFVLVQRGFPRLVMACASSRIELIETLVGARTEAMRQKRDWRRPRGKDFRAWAKSFTRYAQGAS